MPRKLRIEYPGAIYHVMNRGDHGEDIFKDDIDRHRFIRTLGDACRRTEWQIHAYCLMRNHFHLVIETPQPNLVVGMKWLLGVYTKRYNFRHKLYGHLFAGRYKALLVDGTTSGYLRTVCDYVHLNPVRAKLVGGEATLETFPWSSYPAYLCPQNRPKWLRVDRLLGERGIPRDSEPGRKEFSFQMQQRRTEEHMMDYRRVRQDWCLGNDEFRAELLAATHERVGLNHYGSERRETAEEKAKRLVAEGLKLLGWDNAMLETRPKGDKDKVELARRLRSETTMSLKWIAQRLHMGSWTYVSSLLNHKESSKAMTGTDAVPLEFK